MTELNCEELIITQFEVNERKLLEFLDGYIPPANTSSTIIEDVVSGNAELPQRWLEGLECCVSALANLSPAPSLASQLTIVKKVLQFCQKGELAGSDLYEQLGFQLGNLFKKTYSLLKGCLEMVSKGSYSDRTTLLIKITEVASLSLDFDPSLVVLCWRSIGRLMCVSSDHFSTKYQVLEQLSLAIVTTIQQSSMQDDPLMEKRLKCGRFLCSLLIRLLQENPNLVTECVNMAVDLLLTTHQSVYKVENVILQANLEANLMLLRDPLVECMSGNLNFLRLLLQPSKVSPGQHCGWGLCLVALCKHYPSISDCLQNYCLGTVSSRSEAFSSCHLLDAIFLCVENCHLELNIPVKIAGVMSNGQPQCHMSFYELICSHVCVVISSLSDCQLHQVETNLLQRVFSTWPYSALLASDLLVFIARLGGDDVAHTYCQFLVQVLQSVQAFSPSQSGSMLFLASLFNRMLGLLSSTVQIDFLSFYMSHENLLWTHIKVHSLHPDTLNALAPRLVTNSISLLSKHSTSPLDDRFVPSLYCLCAIFSSSSAMISVDADSSHVVFLLLQLLSSSNSSYCHELCLHFFSNLLSTLPPPVVTEVFSFLSMFACSDQSLSVSLALCHFLGQCSTVQFHPSIQSGVMEVISQSYLSLLTVDHWLLKHHALEALRKFAEVTPHPSAVEACIPPHLSDLVITFLCKVPFRFEVYQQQISNCILLSHPNHPLKTVQEASVKAIKELQSAWEKVQIAGQLSTELLSQIAILHESISSFLARHHHVCT